MLFENTKFLNVTVKYNKFQSNFFSRVFTWYTILLVDNFHSLEFYSRVSKQGLKALKYNFLL